jgi:putative peptidoglycan lipid II flippase
MVLLRSTVTVGSFTMVSRVLGFCRDILIATFLGAGVIADVFFVAFKAPNLFRRLFAEGAFNAAFVPQFAGILEYNGKIKARVFAEHALSILLWSTLIFVVCVQILMPYLMVGLAPGFTNDTEQFNLAVLLTRITFPYLLFISLASLMSGVLNSLGKFAAAAATPILLNLCLIGSIIIIARYTDTPAHALAWGVTIAGVIQFIWLLFNCGWAGFWLRLIRPQFTNNISKMIRRILPAAVGAGVYQISLLIDTILASLLPSGSISFLFFADRVNQLPLGVIGVAVGTALLPLMSRQLSVADHKGALDSQNRAIELSLFLTLPAAVGLVVLAEPTISVLFERGAFDAVSAKSTAEALAMYAIGLPAYVVIKALIPGFFAREDTSTPVKIAAVSLFINLILNLILMGPFLHIGIAAATAISAWCNALALAFVLKRRGYFALDPRNIFRLPRMAVASVLMGTVLFSSCTFLNNYFVYETPVTFYILTTLVFAGLIIYLSLSFLFNAVKWSEFKQLFLRKVT